MARMAYPPLNARDLIAHVGGAFVLIVVLPHNWGEAALIWLACSLSYFYGRAAGAGLE